MITIIIPKWLVIAGVIFWVVCAYPSVVEGVGLFINDIKVLFATKWW